MKHNRIGLIDSGVGGLSVYREIRELLPNLDVLYLADSAYIPYGTKSPEFIRDRSKELVAWMLTQGVEMIVIACNTITVTALDSLRDTFPEITFIGTVPAIKTASEVTQNNRIGVLSTTRTAESEYVDTLVKQFATSCTVISQGTDELVPLVEKGEIRGGEVGHVLQRVLQPFITASCDTLVLGCTHFPFLTEEMEKLLGSSVRILDSGEAIAKYLETMVQAEKVLSSGDSHFYTTGELGAFSSVVKRLLQRDYPEAAFFQAQI